MLATLADFFVLPPVPETRTTPAPDPLPRSGPLLMGDILTTRGGEPELLLRWREDRAAQSPR